MIWRAGWLAACVIGLSFVPALRDAARAQTLDQLNAEIIEHPDNVDLNLEYARTAEHEGKLRLALAAYERILINTPDNAEAQRGYERIRRVIEPPNTSLRVEIGEQWDSNPADLSSNGQSDFLTMGRATWVDERQIGGQRWRTAANFYGEVYQSQTELNYAYVSGSIGPMIDLSPTLAAIPALGAAVSTFDDTLYYKELNAGVTFEGHEDSSTFWMRLRAGWRDYGDTSTSDQGAYVEAMGGISHPRIFSDNDWVVAVPWLRWSDIDGEVTNSNNDPIAPGKYTEVGAEATYNYRFNDHLFASVGAEVRDRFYSTTQVDGKDRHDIYVAPKAALTVWNPMDCTCGVTLSYRYRDNQSNDPFSDYNGSNVMLSVSREF
ncbi:MAG: porin family protein [Terricaulis sp.]